MTEPSTDFHMLREIFDQPRALAATLARYVDQTGFRPENTAIAERWLRNAPSILIVASGSSRHAGLAAQLMFQEFSGIHVDVEYSSEYIHRSNGSMNEAAVIVVSQSGETADTLAALRKARTGGKSTLAITNVAHSSMTKEADVTFPTEAGIERAIPATKSFTAQLLNLWLLALLAARSRGRLTHAEIDVHLAAARDLPALIERQLKPWQQEMRAAAARFAAASGFLFLGRAIHFPIALEGALKLKESAYVTAEGYPCGELKHGPNALVSRSNPLLMLATVDPSHAGSVERYDKTVQLMRDLQAQGASVLALSNTNDRVVRELATQTIEISPASDALLAMQEVIPLQLFAFHMALIHGNDVDHPRNLVKSVVTE